MKYVFLIILLIGCASAKVGVLVEFPGGDLYIDCVDISENSSAYSILQKTSLELDWTNDGAWGRALCKIDDTGSDPAGDSCSDWSSYWAFSLSLNKDSSWTTHAPVGFTMGGCWNRDYTTPSYDGHYCAQDGDVIGLHYTNSFPSGYPEFKSFYSICEESPPRKDRVILRSSLKYWTEYALSCGLEFDRTTSPQNIRYLCRKLKDLFSIDS